MKDFPPRIINFPVSYGPPRPGCWLENPAGGYLLSVQKTIGAIGGYIVAAKRLFLSPSMQVVLAFGSLLLITVIFALVLAL